MNRLTYYLNKRLKKSYWYKNILFKDCEKFWHIQDEVYDIVNLGSNSGVYDFDYTNISLKCANWAFGPQTINGDWAILRQFKKNLHRGSVVIYPLCPFTSISGAADYVDDRCYSFLNPSLIPNAHFLRLSKIQSLKEHPLYAYPLWQFLHDIKKVLLKKDKNKLKSAQLEADAERWLAGWKDQFKIDNLSEPFYGHNKLMFDKGVVMLSEFISYCHDCGYKLVIVIPPMYSSLASMFSCSDRNNLVDSFIRAANDNRVQFINMMDDVKFTRKSDYYQNSYYMNSKGAKIFTKYIINKILQ